MKTSRLQKNLDKRMDALGIKTYTKLLCKIGERLGKENPEDYAIKARTNFTKMLRKTEDGGRTFKYEMIIPIESILGVPIAKLVNESPYEINVDPNDVPFLKSFRHYAYYDDPNLYKELNNAKSIYEELIIRNNDEYDKSFLDYLVEYQSINGIRYLVSEFGFHYDFTQNKYLLNDIDCTEMLFHVGEDQISKLIIDKGDKILFKKIYGDIFDKTIEHINSILLTSNHIFKKEFFIDQLMHNKELLEDLSSRGGRVLSPKINLGIVGQDNTEVPLVNPILVICLNYGLNHIDEFSSQVKEIIECGIEHNSRAKTEFKEHIARCYVDKYGFVYLGREIIGNMIVPSKYVCEDKAINKMLSELLNTAKDIRRA